jgi:endonuclease/exonuclease/phosphatase family metal-dependent hydrolase
MMRGGLLAAAAFAATAGLAAPASAQWFVHPVPFFDPSGAPQMPYHIVRAAIFDAPSGEEVRIAPGVYPETFTVNESCTLTAASGPVTIGRTPSSSTKVSVVSYNTHLFGDEVLGALPDWLDGIRAQRIATALRNENADVITLQEVWDPEFFPVIRDGTAYPHGFYGNDHDGLDPLNSGLFVMSKSVIAGPSQAFFDDEYIWGEDQFASKGYLQGTITKNGFSFGIFTTHTQSGDGSNASIQATRELQCRQLGIAVAAYRLQHPSHAVIVTGDFNIIAFTGEYVDSMREEFMVAQAAEAAANWPLDPEALACTSCRSNSLNLYFNPDAINQRIDFMLYCQSLDGTVKIKPTRMERREYKGPTALSSDGLTTDDLSDHYGLFGEFELYRQ